MSNKNLLNESTIRRFMKLGSLTPIHSDSFIRENFTEEEITEAETEEVETLEEVETEGELEEMAYSREDEALPAEEDPQMDMDVPAEEEPALEASSEMEEFAKKLAQGVADAIESASDGSISVSVEGGDEPTAEEEPEGAAPAMDLDPAAPEGEQPEVEMPSAEEEEEDLPLEEDNVDFNNLTAETREEIVQEVYRRIAKKLLKSKLS